LNKQDFINKWKKYNIILYRKFLCTVGFTKDKTSRNLFKLFQFALYAIIIVFIINLFSIGKSGYGEFGDFFGGVLNPILTFLTFMGLLITIILQQSELKQSRKEFKGQKESLENQEFDNKFFQMLNLFNMVINNLEYKLTHKDNLKGKQVFPKLKELLKDKIKPKTYKLQIDEYEHFKIEFNNFNNNYDVSFKYYFINLYQILKYVDKNSINKREAKEYTNIIRAQLSKNELVLLFYNAIGVIDFSKRKYKKLIEKYSLFEHLRYDDIADNLSIHQGRQNNNNILVNQLLMEYKETAFGKNNFLIEHRQKLIEEKDNKT
jgi:hypothetical protein